jgi:hypothetical protein
MSREVRRVPLTFDWPHNQVWAGYLMPDHLTADQCPDCDGTGYSPRARHLQDLWYGHVPFQPADNGSTLLTADTPAVRAFAERNVAHAPGYHGTGEPAVRREAQRLATLWNSQWCHHLNQDDVDALAAANRLRDFTHTCVKGDGWQPKTPPATPTAAQVNEWSLRGMRHDAINCWVVVKARCAREGTEVGCGECEGTGQLWRDDEHKAAHEAWEPTDPPTGDGWQLWETVSEGSPISPVFGTADGLAQWMADPERGRNWVPLPAAQRFVAEGWAPSLVATPGAGVVSGVEWVGMSDPAEAP